MEVPKIQLSATEIDLMNDAGIILTKNSILKKIRDLLETIQHQQTEWVAQHNSNALRERALVPPKISRGESYLGLPYLILDYPRNSGPGDFFFIRSMFWWGNYFSSTLHISGASMVIMKEGIRKAKKELEEKDYYMAIGDDPWVHHFEEDNYKKISQITEEAWAESLQVRDYIKIAAKWPLNDVHLAAIKMYESWKFLLSITGLVT